MVQLQIRGIGPIVDTGLMNINQFNIFIGPQSSGKSTIMKILSYCMWVEKDIIRSRNRDYHTHWYRFVTELQKFHKFSDNFFSEHSIIHYKGEWLEIRYDGGTIAKNKKKANAEISIIKSLPVSASSKISFIPSERNLASAIKNIDKVYKANELDNLFNYIFEWNEAKGAYDKEAPANIKALGDIQFYYNEATDEEVIRLRQANKEFQPYFASSGLQSSLPIFVMADYLTRKIYTRARDVSMRELYDMARTLLKDESNVGEVLKNRSSELKEQLSYKSTHLFIEEPEQNLFPTTQQELIYFLVERIQQCSEGKSSDSTLCMTTHSPYVLTALNVLALADEAKDIDAQATQLVLEETDPIGAHPISMDKISAYYISAGRVNSITDLDLRMLKGEDLDRASEQVEAKQSALYDIIYSNR